MTSLNDFALLGGTFLSAKQNVADVESRNKEYNFNSNQHANEEKVDWSQQLAIGVKKQSSPSINDIPPPTFKLLG